MSDEVETLRAERDLYRALLDLGSHEDVVPFLDEALGLITGVARASQGYLAVQFPGETVPRWAIAKALSGSALEAVRRELSSGIIAEALRSGRTISTASALEDPRFSGQHSVQAQRIRAVLCAPLGGTRPVGVLYLSGRGAPGPFSERDRALAELFALRLAPFVERLAKVAAGRTESDPTAEWRAKLQLGSIAGRSAALAELFRQLYIAAGVDLPVLLMGESGTGKTELARALHESSKRSKGPFVEVNCAALPETLFEAELFGAEKGAHSTATKKMPGRVAAAETGTLFLDELGEMPLSVQAKLLQFLQSKRYHPLGSPKAVEADVRVVAATNVELPRLVREKKFREDLYYRLEVLTLRVPSLRERAEDVEPIAEYAVAAQARLAGKPLRLSFAARAALRSAEWPGNARQLVAAVQRGAAFALGEQAEEIEPSHLFPAQAPKDKSVESAGTKVSVNDSEGLSWQDATRKFQKQLLQEALASAKGNVSEAARRLGLARSHFYELLRSHGLGKGREE